MSFSDFAEEFYLEMSHCKAPSAIIIMITCNYRGLSHSADDNEWVLFIAFKRNIGASSTSLFFWPPWMSQQTDMWQWYNEWLTQSVTWYLRMACFFSRGPVWIEHCDLGEGTHSYPEGPPFPLRLPHCLQHYVLLSPCTGLWQLYKNVFDRKFPCNPPIGVAATHAAQFKRAHSSHF